MRIRTLSGSGKLWTTFGLAAMLAAGSASGLWAAAAKEIDVGADATLKRFYEKVSGGERLVKDAKGVLVFPGVIKAGIGLGGEYGEGALRIRGKTADYYNVAAASLGFQLGVQKKSLILLFMNNEVLTRFRTSSGWKAGVDASIAVIKVGAGGAMDSSRLNEPVLAFVLDQKGLMYNLSLEGAKFTKLKK